MGFRPRCPVCNRWGSSKLDDFCNTHYKERYDGNDEKNPFADFDGDHTQNPFIPDDFGIIKDKFGYEER